MDGRKLVVVEANEVPRRILEDLAPTGKIPFLAGLLDDGQLIETIIDDPAPRELYPSQTWASVNTGAAFEDHGVYWYADPKPSEFPLYWQLTARAGRSVGLVNTLHSSPVGAQCDEGDYRFVLPDCFSADPQTIPPDLMRFQQVNRSLTAGNGRSVGIHRSAGDVAALAVALPAIGLRAGTAAEVARLIGGVAVGLVPRERLRTGQFLLLKDLFLHLLKQEAPDLGVLFTNHVAAPMHRYWYATYPQDFVEHHYGPGWIRKYRYEIPAAVVSLDRYLQTLSAWCVATDRTLVVLSSMGQGPSPRLESEAGFEAVMVNPRLFLDAIGVGSDVDILGAMVPQLTLDCRTPAAAADVATRLADVEAGEVFWDVDGVDSVVTLTYRLDPVSVDSVKLAGARRSAESIGVQVYEIDDHSSGRHIPRGILGVANSPTFKPPDGGEVDGLEVAPALLNHLGVAPASHHLAPGFVL